MSTLFYMGSASQGQVQIEDQDYFEKELSKEAQQTAKMLTALRQTSIVNPSSTQLSEASSTVTRTAPTYTSFEGRSSSEDDKERTVPLSKAHIRAEKTNRLCCAIL